MPVNRVVISGLFYGQLCQNRLHFFNPDGVLTPQQIAEDIRDNWIAQVRQRQSASYTYNKITVYTLTSTNPPTPFDLAVNAQGSGTADNNLIPFSCQILRFRTNILGRQGRGRYYMAAHTAGATSNGTATSANISAWATVLTALKNRYLANGTSSLRLVVTNDPTPAQGHLVTDILLAPLLGVQRRRNIGVGI